ncbi:GNAT family N-acetyltransferase [Natronorubrum sp. DTA28]|uniref:GNAT family N-acetyltransferase n=1 Tax=Natronorubrum sp. DTA28 TaxID=3447019 RepID=UPI003F874616
MGEQLAIRRYEPRDKNDVWRVHERAFRATLPQFFPAMNRDLRNVPDAYLADGDFLVGEVEDEIAAIGGFVPMNERTVELKSLRVCPDHWRRGYGRALIAALEDRMREQVYERVVLYTSEDLAASQSLYRNEGYRETSRKWHAEIDMEMVHFEKLLCND